MEVLYKGYSTHNYLMKGGSFGVSNVDLVNLDILNHLFTETDERVMMPGFGTTIPILPFEPLDTVLIEQLRDDIERVIAYDPRVEQIKLTITPYYDSNALVAAVTLRYIELNIINDLEFVINIETGEL